MEIRIPTNAVHNESYGKIRSYLESQLENSSLSSHIKSIEYNDNDMTIRVAGRGIEGLVFFSDNELVCKITMGIFVRPFSGEIRSRLEQSLMEALSG